MIIAKVTGLGRNAFTEIKVTDIIKIKLGLSQLI